MTAFSLRPARRAPGLATGLLLVAFAASAAAADQDVTIRRLPVRIDLDAEGRVTAARAAQDYVPAPLRQLVEGSASRARFRPATAAATPAAASLWVTAVTRIEFDADGDMTARVIDVVGGGGLGSDSTSLTPRLPGNDDAGADVVATAVFAATGRVDLPASRVEVVAMHEDPARPLEGERRQRRERDYIDAVRAGMRRWRWTPDTVAGRPLRGEFTVALHFASLHDRMRRDWTPRPPRPTTFRALPDPGIEPAALLSWEPARTGASAGPGVGQPH
jgi:hypothetical protein